MITEARSLVIPEQTAVDADVVALYHQIESNDGSVSDRLAPASVKSQFERGRFESSDGTYLPNFMAYDLDADNLLDEADELSTFKTDLAEFGDSPITQAYSWRVNERLANVYMAMTSLEGDMRRFSAYNNFVYGLPQHDIFKAVADHYFVYAMAHLRSRTPAVRAAALDVIGQLDGLTDEGDQQLLSPDNEVFAAVKAERFKKDGYFALALAGVELPDGKIDREAGDPIIRQVGRNMGADLALENAAGLTWSVKAAQDTVRRPADYTMPQTRFIGLPVGHELQHYLEHVNGGRLALRLAQTGLDRYEVGNEGRGVVQEQIAYPNFKAFAKTPRWQMILRRHLGTALALGYGNGAANFAGVYATVHAIDSLYEIAKTPDNVEAAQQKAKNRSWSLLESIYKGSDGTTPYRRYGIYLEGTVACWQAAALDPTVISRGDLGKFDITNPRHNDVLQKTGALIIKGAEQ